jgi:hypothetical protein
VREDCAEMLVLLVEATQYIEDEDAVGDVGAQVIESTTPFIFRQ